MRKRHVLGLGGLSALALVTLAVGASEPGNLTKITDTTSVSMGGTLIGTCTYTPSPTQ